METTNTQTQQTTEQAEEVKAQETETKQTEQKLDDGKQSDADDGTSTLSIEEQLAKLQKDFANERAKNKMLEKKLDKTKAGLEEYRTKWNESLTDVQREEQERREHEAEREERIAFLEKKNAIDELSKNYLKLGYPEEKAEEIAQATYEGDQSTVFRIQAEVDTEKKKAWEADFIKSNPQIITGAGNGVEEDPLIRGFKSVPAPFH